MRCSTLKHTVACVIKRLCFSSIHSSQCVTRRRYWNNFMPEIIIHVILFKWIEFNLDIITMLCACCNHSFRVHHSYCTTPYTISQLKFLDFHKNRDDNNVIDFIDKPPVKLYRLMESKWMDPWSSIDWWQRGGGAPGLGVPFVNMLFI